ncbi:winged helix-turn-helix domain-containing protein [Escherichia albertii]|uniref:winged helix-turn-helix domain-containing protein n=1 Tax=Escherichia albertii TaxID=208962 RepID=UPI000BF38C0D|nr:winged helix-turn-helix domain-containing protein [Escherichia albertii]PFF94823.1 MarR family transcriptional regulator [Escherichia albertii]
MNALDYIRKHPDCSGAEIAAALNLPVTTAAAQLRKLWKAGKVTRKERSTGGRFSYRVNELPFGCSNPLTHMFNQLLKEARK